MTDPDPIEAELRALWRHLPDMTTDKFVELAPLVTWHLSDDQDPQEALDALQSLLVEYGEEKDIDALAAALAFYTDGNVDARLFDYALTVGKEEGRTTRRWAERGAKKVAALIRTLSEDRPGFEFNIKRTGDRFDVSFAYDAGDATHRVLAYDLDIGEDIRIRNEDPDDEVKDSWEGVPVGKDGLLDITVKWVCAVTPEVSFVTWTPVVATSWTMAGKAGYSLQLEEASGRVIETP